MIGQIKKVVNNFQAEFSQIRYELGNILAKLQRLEQRERSPGMAPGIVNAGREDGAAGDDEFEVLSDLYDMPDDWFDDLLVYDVGMNVGEDAKYYLEKGFKVVAIEADPVLCEQVEEELKPFVDSGRLRILNLGISDGVADELTFYVNERMRVWSSFDRSIAERAGDETKQIVVPCQSLSDVIAEHGEPYFVKIDIEGFDEIALRDIMVSDIHPPYLSVENGFSMLSLLESSGYHQFKYIQQNNLRDLRPKFPSREGKYVNRPFVHGSSGPFGEDTPGRWMSYKDAFVEISAIWDMKTGQRLPNWLDEEVGWFDLHARHKDAKAKTRKLINTTKLPLIEKLPEGKGRRLEGGRRLKENFTGKINPGQVSVITVVKNNKETLERCIQSVLNQTYKNIEHIIIDGNSDDGTVDIIKKYSDSLDYFVSEDDDGLYQAMNKGIRASHGEYIAILNSDDWFEDDGIEKSVNSILESESDFSIGWANIIDEKGDNVYTWKIGNFDDRILVSGMSFCHQAVIAHRDCYEIAGLYDESFKISSDYKWVKAMYKHQLEAVHIEEPIVNFTYTGLSVTARPVWKKECGEQLGALFPELNSEDITLLIDFIYKDSKTPVELMGILKKMRFNTEFTNSFSQFMAQRLMENGI